MAEIGNLNVRVGLDATGFQNGVSVINRELKKVQSEFKLASSEIGKHGSELDKLRAKSDSLTKQKELQSAKVEALRQAHQRSVETKGADAKATQDLEIKLNQAQTRLNDMEQDLKSVNSEIAKQSTSWYQMGKALEPIGQKMQAVGKQMQDVGKNLTTRVTLPLVGIGTAAAKVGSDFQAGMSEVQAISGVTGNDLKALEDIAKEMGSTTRFSATQSAEGLKYMALAGWDTHQMVSALPGVLDLAAAANMSLAQASDIVTDTMSAFQMEASEAGKAADIFAATSSKSNTDVRQLGEAMKYAGAAANAAGMDLVQTNTILGMLADSGIKGSQAGTAFAAMLRDVRNSAEEGAMAIGETAVAVYDAEGNMRDLGRIMADVEAATKGMSHAQRDAALGAIFGEQAIRGVNIMLAEGSGKYAELEAAIRGSDGAASSMAATMQDNLQGELTKLKSALEGVGIQIFEVLVPHLNSLVMHLQHAVAWFASLDAGTQESLIKVAALAAALGPLLVIGGKVVAGAGAMVGAFSKISIALAGKTAAMGTATAATGGLVAGKGALAAAATALTGPVGLAVAAVAALTVGGIALAKHLKQDSIPAIDLFGDEVSASTQEAVGGFMELNEQATLALNQLSWSGQSVTKEMAEGITANFTQMAEDVQAGLEQHHEASLSKLTAFMESSVDLTEAEQEEILRNMQSGYENRKQAIADGEARIKEILDTASAEKRAITKAEQEEINAIQRNMVDTGIQVLTENEIEAKAIMERMKAQAGEMSALQAAEVVQNSIQQKTGAIQAAEEQYDEVIREIIRQRDEAGSITKEQADRLIQEAKRQRDGSIKNAQEMHQRVITEAKAQATEHVNQVDWTTGEVMSKWQVMKNNVAQRSREIRDDVRNRWEEIKSNTGQRWEEIRSTINDKWNNIRSNTQETVANIRNNISSTWDQVWGKTNETWENMKASTTSAWQNMRTTIDENGGGIRGLINTFTETYQSTWDNALTVMDQVTGEKFSAMASKVTHEPGEIWFATL